MRYYFDFSANGVETVDSHGVELPDLESAQHEAFRAVACIANDESAPASGDFAVTIRTDAGVSLSRVAARFTIEDVAEKSPIRASEAAVN